MAQQQIKEIITINVELDRHFIAFLDKFLSKSNDNRLKAMADFLSKRMKKDLAALDRLKFLNLDKTEIVKEVPPVRMQAAQSPQLKTSEVETFFFRVLEYEQTHFDFYRQLRELVLYKKSREICDMMIDFKIGQIDGIRQLAQNFHLAV